ncbi:MAG TPA: sugar kinase [Rhodopila sp.]|uniref:sugar kinase n=1 Tax=Rhodopila sp. TaxID=2480087 RepID=UPI002C6C2B8E|nr:sugar kinase [Rhodopila sp.]HVY15146.1 sugar kinase [Rhodopila sp.]
MVDLLCMGEPMLEFNQLPANADGTCHYLEGHGGDTSNAAIAAARQGATVGMITALGQDMPGDSFMALWAREGVDATTVQRTDRGPTGVYFVTHDTGGHHFLHYRAGSAAACYRPDDLPLDAIARAKMLYVSGISQGISAAACDAVFAAIDGAVQHGVKVAYDTNYRPKLWPPARAAAVMHAAMARADYAMPGQEDVQTLTGLTDPDAMLDFYLRLGCRVVVLKMGGQGAYLGTPDGRVRVPAHPVASVDATGAGDTFCGSFLARIIHGDGPEAAVRYASVAAALKCTGYGAVAPIPYAAQVRAALEAAASCSPR